MTKALRIFLVIVMVFFVLVLFGIVYFGSRIGAIYPSIKTYNFNILANKLAQDIDSLQRADTTIKFYIIDTTTDRQNNHYFHSNITVNRNGSRYSYDINYFNTRDKTGSTLRLMGAFDKVHHSGGYKRTDKGVDSLMRYFEQHIIGRISK